MNGALNKTTRRGGAYLLPFLFLLIIAKPYIAFGQEMPGTAITHHLWINAGIGGTSIGPGVYLTISDFNITNNTLISIGGVFTSEMEPHFTTPGYYSSRGSENDFWDARLLIGKGVRGKHYLLSASAGIAYVGGTEVVTKEHPESPYLWESYEGSYYHTIGIPIQVQAHCIPLNFIGIGLEGIANINSKHTIFGVFLSLQLGRLYAD